MDRLEYMARLEAELACVSDSEREDAMAYYNEYFDEAGPQGEAQAIDELGPPERVAAQIKSASAARDGAAGDVSAVDAAAPPKKGVSALWWVIVGILALPIALPIAILLFVLAVALVAVTCALTLALAAVVVAAFVCGVAAVVAGIGVLFSSAAAGMFYIGCGLVSVGAALLACLLIMALTRAMGNGVYGLFGWARRRGDRKRDAGKGGSNG
ncbi:MAG: DUF1700 domain-containing protein [Clostridiales Family XIII bacterium]|jgi:uncharacterized membrane protein|nr:DUF1700 domain-containing protein [Clostridiales Family XIII bacterium]